MYVEHIVACPVCKKPIRSFVVPPPPCTDCRRKAEKAQKRTKLWAGRK